jgi:hypothetical protein
VRPATPWESEQAPDGRTPDRVIALVLIAVGAASAAAIVGHRWPLSLLPPGSTIPAFRYDLRILKLMIVLEGGGLAGLGLLVAWRGAWLRRLAREQPLASRPGLALAIVALAHLTAFLFVLPPQQILSPEPVNTGNHLAHYARIFADHRILSDGWRMVGYDPFFLCGAPAGLAFDVETRGDALFTHLFAFLGLAYATKSYILLVHLALPFSVYAAGRILGLGRSAAVLAALVAVLHWSWGRPFVGALRWAGMHSFLLACQLTLVGIACAIRFFDRDHRVRAWSCAGLAAVLLLIGFVHPAGLLFLTPAVLLAVALGLRRLRARDRAALLLAVVVAGTAHMSWIVPAARHGLLFGGPQVGLQLASLGETVRLFAQPSSGLALAILLAGIAGLVLWRPANTVRTYTLAGTAALWFAAAAFGRHFGVLSRIECARALVPLVLLLGFPAGVLLDTTLARARRGTPALLVLLGLVIAATFPAFASVLDSRFYYVHRLDATLDPRFAQLAAAIDAAAPTQGRLLFEATVNARTPISAGIPLEALLPIHTGREVVGPPEPGAPFAAVALEFEGGSLGGRPLATWNDAEFAGFLERYDVGSVVAWSPVARAFLATRAASLQPAGSVHGFDIYRSTRPPSRLAAGTARVQADYDRIDLDGIEGERIVLRYHWAPELEAMPPRLLERIDVPGDARGFVGLQALGAPRIRIAPDR